MLIPDNLRHFLCLHSREPADRARLESNLRGFPRFPISESATLVCSSMSDEEFVLAVAGDLPTGLVSILALNGTELLGVAGTKNLMGELWARTAYIEPDVKVENGAAPPLAARQKSRGAGA